MKTKYLRYMNQTFFPSAPLHTHPPKSVSLRLLSESHGKRRCAVITNANDSSASRIRGNCKTKLDDLGQRSFSWKANVRH